MSHMQKWSLCYRMEILSNLLWKSFYNMYVYHSSTLSTLNLLMWRVSNISIKLEGEKEANGRMVTNIAGCV